MKTFFDSPLRTVLALMGAAVLLMVIVYPEIFLGFKTTFAVWSDYSVEYAATFVLTSFIYQGGVQLWDFFGQMPYFHTFATLGLFKFPNLVTAFSYYLLAPFAEDQAALFHHVFAWAQIMTLLCIKLAGIYLLLGCVTNNRRILCIMSVLLAVFFCPCSFLIGVFYRSYLPLEMYFVLRYFQTLQPRFFAASFLFLIIALGSELLHAGYLYLPVHFFIISCLIWRICFHPVSLKSFYAAWRGWTWKDSAWIGLVSLLVLVPYAYIVKFGFQDLVFGQADSRIGHPFSLHAYFHDLQLALSNPSEFFNSFLNFRLVDTYYIGMSFLFLAMVGLIFSRSTIKWAFAMTIAFIWLLTFPKEGFNLGTAAHWINALTNPLKTLPRSYFNAFQPAFSYLLMPLALLGLEVLQDIYKGKQYGAGGLRLLGLMAAALLLNAYTSLPFTVNVYLTICALSLGISLAAAQKYPSSAMRKWMAAIYAFFVLADILLIVDQSKRSLVANADLKPVVLDAAPQSGLVEMDFENPSVFPFRQTTSLEFSYRDEQELWWPHSVSSDLHHVINQGLNLVWINGYNPRHVSFSSWMKDQAMLEYLKQNDQFIFLAPAAIQASPGALGRICGAGLARQVVEVQDTEGKLDLPRQWPANLKASEDEIKFDQISAALEDGQGRVSEYYAQDGMIIYRWFLPKDFPPYWTSSWFMPQQRYLRFFVQKKDQWQELQATEGTLIRPNTFDVQNIRQGELWAAFPKDDFPMHQRCVLLYPSAQNQGLNGVWRRQSDNWGISYKARTDGWLVIHEPFDPKFRVSVDGKPTAFYRVNQSFIGFPISRGEHKILIQYWPHALLRGMLFISAVLITAGLPLLIVLALRWEEKGTHAQT